MNNFLGLLMEVQPQTPQESAVGVAILAFVLFALLGLSKRS